MIKYRIQVVTSSRLFDRNYQVLSHANINNNSLTTWRLHQWPQSNRRHPPRTCPETPPPIPSHTQAWRPRTWALSNELCLSPGLGLVATLVVGSLGESYAARFATPSRTHLRDKK